MRFVDKNIPLYLIKMDKYIHLDMEEKIEV